MLVVVVILSGAGAYRVHLPKGINDSLQFVSSQIREDRRSDSLLTDIPTIR